MEKPIRIREKGEVVLTAIKTYHPHTITLHLAKGDCLQVALSKIYPCACRVEGVPEMGLLIVVTGIDYAVGMYTFEMGERFYYKDGET